MVAKTTIDLERLQRIYDRTTQGDWYSSQNYLVGGSWIQTARQQWDETALADFVKDEDAYFIAVIHNLLPNLIEELYYHRTKEHANITDI